MSFITEIKNEVQKKQQKSADAKFVAGVFLTRAQGALVLGQRKHGYHLEFCFDDYESALEFCETVATHDILPKLSHRPGKSVVYLKHSDDICNLLALIGADNCLLMLHDEIVRRDCKNTANRRANCDTANINKTVAAASGQLARCSEYLQHGKDAKLLEIAKARLDNPSASYEELGCLLGISKSGVVHRLRKLSHSTKFPLL